LELAAAVFFFLVGALSFSAARRASVGVVLNAQTERPQTSVISSDPL
jgi:hypothetical protein